MLTLNYVNRGKTEVSNVEAAVEGDGVDATARTQYVGNIAAGSSGSIGFALTPNRSGPVKVTLKVSYEDPNLQPQTLEFPVELTAAEGRTTATWAWMCRRRTPGASSSPGRCCW